MKKTLGIVLTLVLALSLSLAMATSVAGDVHHISVDPDPNVVGMAAEYEIVFNITSTLAIGATISIEFPSGTTVPTSYATGNVTVEGVDISQGDISVSGQVVTITLPIGIGAPAEVDVVFTEDAGIINPAAPSADYTVRVKTSQEPTWVTSDDYTIRLDDKSTYEFLFDVPEMIWVNDPADVDVTLQTDVLGLGGYDHVLIVYNVTENPATSSVSFQVYDGYEWLPDPADVDHGQWPTAGNFSVTAAYEETFPFRLKFDKVGVYTIEFVLDDLDGGDIVQDEITVSVTGVSVDVELNKGWNLISLPIIPDYPAIATMLTDIMGDVISVHHYVASTGSWLIYAPPGYASLTTMEDGKAYWINMNAAATLTVVGQAVAPPGYQGLPPSYSVVEGWNMVGFRAMESMEADTYLKGTFYVRIYGFDLDQNGWFSLAASQNMTPGLGYWVAFSEPGTIYP